MKTKWHVLALVGGVGVLWMAQTATPDIPAQNTARVAEIAAGKPVWNPITEMFLDGHVAANVVFPKLHVRYSSKSPQSYLERIAKMVLGGHCVFAMFNDDIYIDQFVKAGHPLARARDAGWAL